MAAKGKTIWVAGGYGYKNKAPFVAITMPGGETCQMSVTEARNFAMQIVEVCESTIQDGFLFEWSQETIKLGDAQAAGFINELRKWREKKGL